MSGAQIGHVPAEIVYYTPVFGALVLAFYRLWSLVLEDRALIPVKRRYWLRATALTALGVLLFEVMTEPIGPPGSASAPPNASFDGAVESAPTGAIEALMPARRTLAATVVWSSRVRSIG